MSQNFWYPPGSSSATSIDANQGSPNTAANAWPVKVTDGTDIAQVSAAGALIVDGSGSTQPVSGPLTDAQLRATPVPVSGTVTANLGTIGAAATEATLSSLNTKVPSNLTVTSTRLLVDGSGVTQPISGTVTVNPLTNSSIVKAQLQDNSGNAINSTSNALNVSVQNASVAVTQSTSPWVTKESVSATATLSNVASSATNVTILAANSSRLGATIFNDSTQNLYLKFGATASSSSFTVLIASMGYYELPTPHLYTGIIDGLWASANGNARVTELS